jgi:hypothetical protein
MHKYGCCIVYRPNEKQKIFKRRKQKKMLLIALGITLMAILIMELL